MAKSKKIVMTGGGTAGHVTPNIALMPALQEAGYEITYIGSYNGMEKELIEAQKIPYIGISSGKLRRYFDWKNFSDPFKVLKGYGQAISILRKLKPDFVVHGDDWKEGVQRETRQRVMSRVGAAALGMPVTDWEARSSASISKPSATASAASHFAGLSCGTLTRRTMAPMSISFWMTASA